MLCLKFASSLSLSLFSLKLLFHVFFIPIHVGIVFRLQEYCRLAHLLEKAITHYSLFINAIPLICLSNVITSRSCYKTELRQ